MIFLIVHSRIGHAPLRALTDPPTLFLAKTKTDQNGRFVFLVGVGGFEPPQA